MPTLTRPGVYVDESAFPSYVSATPGVALACFVGQCPRGPLTPTQVGSWKEFTQWYGGFDPSAVPSPSPLHLAVFSYFSAGGGSAVIIRVTTTASPPVQATTMLADSGIIAPNLGTLTAATGTVAITALATTAITHALASGDQVTLSSGTNTLLCTVAAAGAISGAVSIPILSVTPTFNFPIGTTVIPSDVGEVPTLQIMAANPGGWGNNVYIDILPGGLTNPSSTPPALPLSFTLNVKYNGTDPASSVETWQDMSMQAGSLNQGVNNYAPDIVNSPFNGSKWIRLVDQHSGNPSPQNNPEPVNGVQLSGGLDGSTPASPPAPPPAPQSTDWQTAVQLLDAYPDQPFVLNMCGQNDPTITGPVVNYAQTRGDIFVVLDPPPSFTPSAMTAWAQALTFRSAQAAIYYPQVLIADPYSATVGRTRTIPPGGFIAGQYIATDAARSVAKAPAGLGTSLLGVYGLETVLTNAQQGTLNLANVNCLISVPGSGVVIWGARTLSAYLVTRYIPVSRSLIYLSTQFVAMTKFAVFEPNDWVLWNQITSVLSQFLNQFWQSGGLSGQSASQAFYVTCDQTNNIPDTIQQGIVNIEVGVALQYPAEFVVIKIGQWAGGQSVTTTTS